MINFNNCKHPQKAKIAFGFDESNYRQFYISIRSIDKEKLSQDEKQKISDIMTQAFSPPSGVCNGIYPWWIYGNDATAFGHGFIRWQDSVEPWRAMLDGSLAKKIFEITHKTYEAFRVNNQIALLCDDANITQQASTKCINSEDMTDEIGRSLDPESRLSETNPGAEIPS